MIDKRQTGAAIEPGNASAGRRFRHWLPLAVFAVLAAILYLGFSLRDPHLLPSALLGRPFPEFDLPLLGSSERASRERLLGDARLVNVWATWCPTCLAEHGELKRIRAQTGLSIIGINYKDDDSEAIAWLARHGNPYDFNLVDASGDLGVELGVYGAPETFLLDAEGIVRHKHVGAVTAAVWQRELQPALAALSQR